MSFDPQKIRERRKSLKLLQVDAAAAAGLTQGNWARIESGAKPDPKLSTALRVAAALKTAIEKLI